LLLIVLTKIRNFYCNCRQVDEDGIVLHDDYFKYKNVPLVDGKSKLAISRCVGIGCSQIITKSVKDKMIPFIFVNLSTVAINHVNIFFFKLSQTFFDFIFIPYIKEQDERIELYIQPKNLGYNKNFEFLLKQSKANYIMFSDHDDIWNRNISIGRIIITYIYSYIFICLL